jgi:multiple antibiotic resistance protein
MEAPHIVPKDLQFAALALSAVFVMVDPVGLVPLFLGLTPNATPDSRRIMARRACVVAFLILLGFAMFGTRLLESFGVTLDAFKVAGGLLMLLTAMEQLRAHPDPTRTSTAEQEEGSHKADISITTLAIPLLAGPGAIATVAMLMGRAQGPVQQISVVVALVVTFGVTYLALKSAERLAGFLGTTGRLITERLMGLLLAAFAMQFILDGVRATLLQGP